MSENPTYLKVVRRVSNIPFPVPFRDHYVSALGRSLPKEWLTRYRPGQWVEAKVPGTGLFVFTEMDAALKFATEISKVPSVPGKCEVWKCDGEGSIFLTSIVQPTINEGNNGEHLKDYWNGGQMNPTPVWRSAPGLLPIRTIPKATQLFKRVKLTRCTLKLGFMDTVTRYFEAALRRHGDEE